MPIYISADKFSWPLDTEASTVFVSFDNEYPPSKIGVETFVCLFSLYADASYECTLGVSGEHEGEVVLRLMQKAGDGLRRHIIRSGRYLGRGISTVALQFHKNDCAIFLDGIRVCSAIFEYREFSRIYFGSCEHSIIGDVFLELADCHNTQGRLHKFLAIPRTMTYSEILKKTMLLAGKETLEFIKLFLDLEENITEISGHIAALESRGSTFQKFIEDLPWALDEVLKTYPAGSDFVEETIRDKVFDLLRSPHSAHKREEYEKIGRTDLTVRFPRINEAGNLQSDRHGNPVLDTYRVEFKQWGASGYKKLPLQPLKYMSADEPIGATVLIDRRKCSDIKAFLDIVRGQTEYPCVDASDRSYFSTSIPYFVSLHRDPKFRNLRLIVNFYLRIPKKG